MILKIRGKTKHKTKSERLKIQEYKEEQQQQQH
jgi:hypothetical protein